jgi:hypothetical protein
MGNFVAAEIPKRPIRVRPLAMALNLTKQPAQFPYRSDSDDLVRITFPLGPSWIPIQPPPMIWRRRKVRLLSRELKKNKLIWLCPARR